MIETKIEFENTHASITAKISTALRPDYEKEIKDIFTSIEYYRNLGRKSLLYGFISDNAKEWLAMQGYIVRTRQTKKFIDDECKVVEGNSSIHWTI